MTVETIRLTTAQAIIRQINTMIENAATSK